MHGMLWLNWCAFANAEVGECTMIAFSTDDDAPMQKKERKKRNESRTFVEPEPKCSTLCGVSVCVLCAHSIAAAIFYLLIRACVLVWLTSEHCSFGGLLHWIIFSFLLFLFKWKAKKFENANKIDGTTIYWKTCTNKCVIIFRSIAKQIQSRS